MRLNKYIADSGVASRRGADKLIEEGRVRVNGKKVTELGASVNESNDTVSVDGVKIRPASRRVYIMLNKPKGCITAVKDDRGRKTVMDYVETGDRRVFPVGRLDYDSEGLVILTNDGELAYKLTASKNDVPKTYIVKAEGKMEKDHLTRLSDGSIILDERAVKPAKVRLLSYEDGISRAEITITEGRNRQIRKMFEAVEREVVFLKRIAVGELRLGGLARGAYRYLTDEEIAYLKTL